jgi:hypothetical protein
VIANAGRIGRVAVASRSAAPPSTPRSQHGLARSLGEEETATSLGMAAVVGATFGAAHGLISRNPATMEDAIRLRKAGQTLKQSLESDTALTPAERSVGAAANPNADIPALNDAAINALNDSHVPMTAFSQKLFGFVPLRFGAAGQVKSSPSAFGRLLGGIGLDAVGWADKSVNDFSPAEEGQLLLEQHLMRLHQVWEPGAEEWAKDNGYRFGKIGAGSDFNTQVYRYVRGADPTAEWHPAIKRVGDRIRELNADILAAAKNPGERQGLISRAVQGFENIEQNPNYITRVYAAEKLNKLRDVSDANGIGDTGILEWTKGAIRKAQPDLTDEEIGKLAGWHVKRLIERANGMDEKLNLALSGFDRDQLADVFREAGLEEERINKLLGRVEKDEKTGADARAKRRLLLDENYVLKGYRTASGGTRDVSLDDMVVTDAALLSHIYAKHMNGRIALANFKVRNPETGEMLIDGITSDNEWASALRRMAEFNKDKLPAQETAAITERDTTNLQYMYDRILGRADADATGEAAKWLRRVGDVNYARLGANFGMAQLPETVAPIAHLGIKAAMSVMPAFRKFVTADGEKVLKDELARTVEAMWGLGADAAKGFQYFRHEDTGAVPSGVGNKVDNTLGFTKQVVSHLSGLHIVNAALQRWTGKAIIQKFADMAFKTVKDLDGPVSLENIKPAYLARMRNLGLSDEMLKRVLREVRKNVTTEDGLLFSHKVTRLNMDGWKDQEARAAFENAGFRLSRNIIQTNDIGTMHRWMSKPIAQMLMQFRVFPLVAWEKQFMHGMHMRDFQTFNLMWMSMVSGAATYALQTQLASVGRSDRDKYLTDRLTPEKLALGGFQRAGWSTLLPMFYDTGAYAVGGHPAFDFRTTGNASDVIFGNATLGTIDDLSKASKGLVQPMIQGRQRSQQETRSIARIGPMATWLPWTQLLSTMISSQPLYAPKDSNKK